MWQGNVALCLLSKSIICYVPLYHLQTKDWKEQYVLLGILFPLIVNTHLMPSCFPCNLHKSFLIRHIAFMCFWIFMYVFCCLIDLLLRILILCVAFDKPRFCQAVALLQRHCQKMAHVNMTGVCECQHTWSIAVPSIKNQMNPNFILNTSLIWQISELCYSPVSKFHCMAKIRMDHLHLEILYYLISSNFIW